MAVGLVITVGLAVATVEPVGAQEGRELSSSTTDSTATSINHTAAQPTAPEPPEPPETPEPREPAAGDRPTSETPQPSTTAKPRPSTTGSPSPDPSARPEEKTTTTGPGSESSSTTVDETTATDPLAEEGPRDEEPEVGVVVPPPVGYDGQGAYQAPEVLWSNVQQAESKLAGLKAKLAAAINDYRSFKLRAKELDQASAQLDTDVQSSVVEIEQETRRLQARAVESFRENGTAGSPTEIAPVIDIMRGFEPTAEDRRRGRMAREVLEVKQADIDQLVERRQQLESRAVQLLERSEAVDELLNDAADVVADVRAEITQAELELAAFQAGTEVFISGLVFPIQGEYSVPLINSFGFPRMPGTPDEHWHEGIDIFAPRGAPLVAVERGVITRKGIGRLGGLKLWLNGESGTAWYYAHLHQFAPGVENGTVVEAGQVVGYVGNTGNALGTPPHLHMEMHPGDGRAVNPYPLLSVVSDMERSDNQR